MTALIVAANVARRQMTKYQQAMARAVGLAEDGKRKNGRWAKGSANDEESSSFKAYLARCGAVLDYDAERGTGSEIRAMAAFAPAGGGALQDL